MLLMSFQQYLSYECIESLMMVFAIIFSQMITLGGDAELELVDSMDPFSEGVVFSVRPPKKSWKNIANLSGGEKVLSNDYDAINLKLILSLSLFFSFTR